MHINLFFLQIGLKHLHSKLPSPSQQLRAFADGTKSGDQEIKERQYFYYCPSKLNRKHRFTSKIIQIALFLLHTGIKHLHSKPPPPPQQMRASAEGIGRNARKIIASHHFYHRLPLARLKQIDSFQRLKSWKFSYRYRDKDTLELDQKSPVLKQNKHKQWHPSFAYNLQQQ